jgi:hypothetical protein
MKAAYVEFRLESATMNTREFYASKQGTHKYLTKGAVACAISYSEVLQRNKKDDWSALTFDFDCTPAVPVNIRTLETVYKAGDKADAGLLRYGRQELIMPGSVFRFVAWGDLPPLWEGQVFLIGKKRAAAQVIKCVQSNVEPDTKTSAEHVMPIQIPPLSATQFGAFVPLVLTAYYAIVQVPLQPGRPRLVVNGWGVPLGK